MSEFTDEALADWLKEYDTPNRRNDMPLTWAGRFKDVCDAYLAERDNREMAERAFLRLQEEHRKLGEAVKKYLATQSLSCEIVGIEADDE